MKQGFYFLVSLLFLSTFSASAQNCEQYFESTRQMDDMVMVTTKWQYLIVRGNYSYGIELMNNDKGVTAMFTSKGGVSLEEGDEVIFADVNSTRKVYKFIGMGDFISEAGRPVYKNLLQLDLDAVKWMAANNITTFYIRSNASAEMRKYTLPGNRQLEFNQTVACFYKTIKDKGVKGPTLTNTSFGPPASAKASPAGTTAKGTTANPIGRDQELLSLREQLASE